MDLNVKCKMNYVICCKKLRRELVRYKLLCNYNVRRGGGGKREREKTGTCPCVYDSAVFKCEKPTNVDNNTCALTHLPTHVWLVE